MGEEDKMELKILAGYGGKEFFEGGGKNQKTKGEVETDREGRNREYRATVRVARVTGALVPLCLGSSQVP